jgi:hypothetical protein
MAAMSNWAAASSCLRTQRSRKETCRPPIVFGLLTLVSNHDKDFKRLDTDNVKCVLNFLWSSSHILLCYSEQEGVNEKDRNGSPTTVRDFGTPWRPVDGLTGTLLLLPSSFVNAKQFLWHFEAALHLWIQLVEVSSALIFLQPQYQSLWMHGVVTVHCRDIVIIVFKFR